MALIEVKVKGLSEAQMNELKSRLDKLDQSITEIKEFIMSNADQVKADLEAILASQAKTKGEIAAVQETVTSLQATIAQLEEQIANATNIPQDIVDLVAQAKAGAQQIDDQLPDIA